MIPAVSVHLLLSQSDERLVGYARAGHERAFEALVQRYRRQLLAYCRRLLLSEQRAEDALQQALLQAWVSLRNGNDVSEPRAWLYRIVHNAAVQTLRTSRYDYCRLSESLSGADAPEADLDRRIAVREALAGLAALPEMQREALLRTAIEGRTHQQTAADLGLSEPAVRGLVYRARASLRSATSAIVPPPLIGWALEAGARGTPALERVAGLSGAGGGSVGLAGLLLKGGAVAVTAGALAGGIVAEHPSHAAVRHRQAAEHGRSQAKQLSARAQPVAFTRLDSGPAVRRGHGANAPANASRQTPPQGAYRLGATRLHTSHERPPAPVPNLTPRLDGRTRHGDGTFETGDSGPGGHDGGARGEDSRHDGGAADELHGGGSSSESTHDGGDGGSGGQVGTTASGGETGTSGDGGGQDGKDGLTDGDGGEEQAVTGSVGTSDYKDRASTAETSQEQPG